MSGEHEVDVVALDHLLAVQDGVITRRQLVDAGAAPHDIRRMLRRRDVVRVHNGVYVNHTGPLTWQQSAWAAVLACWPAALSHESALPNPPVGPPIHVAIASHRTLDPLPGIVTHRMARLEERVSWVKRPPRVRTEHAALDLALSKPDEAAAFAVLADVCQKRWTGATRIQEALADRGRVLHRQLLADLLADLTQGACSVLEREYLHLERAHGLPRADRQRPTQIQGKRAYLDVPYVAYGVRVELDGRAFHDNAASRDRDFDRDLESAVTSDALTVRVTYGQVLVRGCRTIQHIATLLERRGWPGPFKPCRSCRPPR